MNYNEINILIIFFLNKLNNNKVYKYMTHDVKMRWGVRNVSILMVLLP